VTARPAGLPEPLYVSRPVLPDLPDFTRSLEPVWESGILTNVGALHEQLERAIAERLGFGRVSLWNNGTSALLGALLALELRGEVVVTPFTFPATVHAVAALGLTPVFADIDRETMTLAPASVAERITPATTAVLGTHLYGISCDTAAIGELARQHGLRVIYDGAHAFGRATPIFEDTPDALGDVTMLSFHATKLFHTVEGGALVTRDAELDRRIRLARNFGIQSETEEEGLGLNGKMSELHAAMGLQVLGLIGEELERRAAIAAIYAERLAGIAGLAIASGLGESKQYFVIRISSPFGSTRDELHETLRSANVFSRRYFFPLASDLSPYAHLPSAADLPVAKQVAQECLVLPLHGSMTADQAHTVADLVTWQHTRSGVA
jgi:dTDP-4-amino-4,6-dideoxygalactose transaminase